MKFSEFINKAFFYISVPTCVGCGKRLEGFGSALCQECKSKYNEVKERECSVCFKPIYNCSCVNDYLDSHFTHKLIKVFRYLPSESLPSNELIYRLKRDNRRDIVNFLSDELISSFKASVGDLNNVIVTNVPRKRSSIKKYGYDHAAALAKAFSSKLGAEYKPLLISMAKKSQKKLTTEERIQNAEFKYRNSKINLKGKTVIIIDDIVTSGASLGACASLIRGLGSKKIIGACIAIAYKDRIKRFETADRFNKRIKRR